MALKVLTLNSLLTCTHATGIVALIASEPWITIQGVPIQVDPDPAGRGIAGCTNTIPGATVMCTATLPVREGKSSFVTVKGRSVILSTVRGHTVCQPPLSAEYEMKKIPHSLVWSAS